MLREVLQRVIVERGQPITEQRRLPIAQNLDHEIDRRDRTQEHRVAPGRRGQWNGNELACPRGVSGALVKLLREDFRKGRLAIRQAVKETRELADEPRAVR